MTDPERRRSNDELLARIDERTETHSRQLKTLFEKLDALYLKKDEFRAEFGPVKNISYGLVGLFLTGIVASILAQILKTHGG